MRGLRIAAVLLACAPLAVSAQDASPGPLPHPSEPGSPLAITNAAGYTERVTRGGTTISNTPRLCVSFENVSDRPLKAVTIELVHRRLDGTVSELKLIKRYGTFAPGVEIRGYQGEKVGIVDGHAAANCPEFSMMIPGISDGVKTEIRPIAAEFEDGTTWASARAPSVLATPAPVAEDATPAPPWDAAHHAGYLAVRSGGGTWQHPTPQVIEIYAPGHHKPSATLTFPKCCVHSLNFDGNGNLLLATTGMHAGLLVYAPGSQEPTKRFPEHDGFEVATDDDGDLAIGGSNSGPDLAVYLHDGTAYRIPVKPGSYAFAPNGELALTAYKGRLIQIYARGATTPARQIDPDPNLPNSGGAGLAYGRNGDLAVMLGGRIRVFEPGRDQPSYSIPTDGPAQMAFDGTGRLVVLDTTGTTIYAVRSVRPLRKLPRDGVRVAADRAGRVAIMNWYRSDVVIVEADGTETRLAIATKPGEIAFSP